LRLYDEPGTPEPDGARELPGRWLPRGLFGISSGNLRLIFMQAKICTRIVSAWLADLPGSSQRFPQLTLTETVMKSTSSSRPNLQRLLIATAAAASAVALTWAPSRANEAVPAAQPASMTVRYADLDLHNPDGLSTLYRRIVTAATVVCGGDSGRTSLSELTEFRRCSSDSIRHAVISVGNHDLSALHVRNTRHRTFY
jgi:UrcA family protein